MATVLIVVSVIYPKLPSLDSMTDYRPKVPLRVYSAEGIKIGEFGEERREIVKLKDVPQNIKQAILAAEDSRFYEHAGVDAFGVLRALVANLTAGKLMQGASTITQQVARNFFLSLERTYIRKLYEILLAFKIESNLSKNKILELYINQIYLGQRSYGFGSASNIYFGRPLKTVTLAQAAMLASLPKSPSRANPVANPKRARARQLYVLGRMHKLGYITSKEHDQATKEEIVIHKRLAVSSTNARYVAELARLFVMKHFSKKAYSSGMRIYTTIMHRDQQAAYRALRKGVLSYDKRHGYRGPEGFADIPDDLDESNIDRIDEYLEEYDTYGDLEPALVLKSDSRKVRVWIRGGEIVEISGKGLEFATRKRSRKSANKQPIQRGSIIRIQKKRLRIKPGTSKKNGRSSGYVERWYITQLPKVEASFVAMDPQTGKVKALVGGFDFGRSQFNHATQAWRQPGSAFKPFIYSAALERGFNSSTYVDDSPISLFNYQTGGVRWRPKNYDNRYSGPITVRDALKRSKNMVSIRLLQSIGPDYAQDYISNGFGFKSNRHPAYLTMALGAGSTNTWEMSRAFSVFANGGFLVQGQFIERITNYHGETLYKSDFPKAGDERIRSIDARNAYVMDIMMRDVTLYGTAAKAGRALKRRDLGGKTGTTNDVYDGWFCGYQQSVAACAWMGYDKPKSLGVRETGGGVALPIWINYMKKILKDVPEKRMKRPDGLVRIDNNIYYDRGDGVPEIIDPIIPSLEDIIGIPNGSIPPSSLAHPATAPPAHTPLVWPATNQAATEFLPPSSPPHKEHGNRTTEDDHPPDLFNLN